MYNKRKSAAEQTDLGIALLLLFCFVLRGGRRRRRRR